jgi:hypothetical protein
MGSRKQGTGGLGSEYEELVHPPGDERPSWTKIVLWLLLFAPVGFYFLLRRFRRARLVSISAATVLTLVLLVALGAALDSGDTNPRLEEASAQGATKKTVTKTPAQLKAARVRAAKVARQRARTKARAASLAKQRARAEARAHAAYVAAANRWHTGFAAYDYGEGLYYRWRDGLGCAEYSDYCWRLEVTTRGGCSSLFVEANEKNKAGTIIGDLIDARDNIPPKTRVLFELDSTSGSTYSVASGLTITCNRY